MYSKKRLCREGGVSQPLDNADYSNVSAFMEAFWGFVWHTVAHSGTPPREDDSWKRTKFSGLKEFVDRIVR